MIKLIDVKKEYVVDKKSNLTVKALDGVSVDFESKGLVAIVGRSGCGKTTLLNTIAGIDTPTGGEILIGGEAFGAFGQADFDYYRNFFVSLIFQEYNLLNDYSVIDNIALACRLQGKSRLESSKKALEALSLVGLEGLAKRKIRTLSGGQQQRVAIARAMAKDSRVILCDEPTGNLDSNTSREIYELLRAVSKNRLVIVVSHDREFADSFADRVIVLSDGKILDDGVSALAQDESKLFVVEQEELDKAVGNRDGLRIKRQKKKSYGMSFWDRMRLIRDNFVKAAVINVIVIVLLTAVISLSTVFLSLYQYNSEDALINTLKANDSYVIQLGKYIDWPRYEQDPYTEEWYIAHGPQMFYAESRIEDIEGIKNKVAGMAAVYPSYFFKKNLQDFTDKFIYTENTAFQFYSMTFREAIAVDDFSTFHLKLTYGQKPQAAGDVLIYDYMADSFLHYGLFDGAASDIVGKTLTDQDTGLSMRISGILKSDYKQYAYIQGKNGYYFEETRLASLEVVFCKPEFIQAVERERLYESIFKCSFFRGEKAWETDDPGLIDTGIKKYKFVEPSEFTFLAAIEDYEKYRGVLVDKKTVASLMDIGVDDVDETVAQEFLQHFFIEGKEVFFYKGLDATVVSGFVDIITAVVDEDLPGSGSVLYRYTPIKEDFDCNNGAFRQIYLSLGKDWKENKKILAGFGFITHSRAFYEANPDFYFEGYTDYTAYGILIQNADFYLEDVKDSMRLTMIILICIAALGMFFFAVLTIKKHGYKIGVLKALGMGNGNIALLFGLQIIIAAMLAFILSIPCGVAIIGRINAVFVDKINSDLVFFAITPTAQALMLAVSLLSVIISTMAPLIGLYFRSPITIIRNNNRK